MTTIAQRPGAVAMGSAIAAGPRSTAFQGPAQPRMEEAFGRIVERHSDLVYSVAFRMLHNVEDAMDAAQEAFISAYRGFAAFKDQSQVSTWLYRIVVNACLMKIRKEKTRLNHLAETGVDNAVAHDWRANPERSAMNSELRGVLDAGLSRLRPEQRVVVVLRDVHGLSLGETAEVLDLSVPAIKTRLRRGRLFLREYLEGYLGRPAPQAMPAA